MKQLFCGGFVFWAKSDMTFHPDLTSNECPVIYSTHKDHASSLQFM